MPDPSSIADAHSVADVSVNEEDPARLLPGEQVDDMDPLDRDLNVEELQIAKEFIQGLRGATLENDGLDPDTIHRLRNPIREPLDISDRFL